MASLAEPDFEAMAEAAAREAWQAAYIDGVPAALAVGHYERDRGTGGLADRFYEVALHAVRHTWEVVAGLLFTELVEPYFPNLEGVRDACGTTEDNDNEEGSS